MINTENMILFKINFNDEGIAIMTSHLLKTNGDNKWSLDSLEISTILRFLHSQKAYSDIFE